MRYYGTLEGALTYANDIGDAVWPSATYTDIQREAALTRASNALDGRYSNQFLGSKATAEQRRAWPRVGAYDRCVGVEFSADTIPWQMENATYALAVVELQSPGATSPTVTPGRVTKSETVDVISRSFMTPEEMLISTPQALLDSFRPVNLAVQDLLVCITRDPASRWIATVV